MDDLIERMAQALVDARVTDCAYGDCQDFAAIAPRGETFGYDTTTGIEDPNGWARVTCVPSDAQWNAASARAEALWEQQIH